MTESSGDTKQVSSFSDSSLDWGNAPEPAPAADPPPAETPQADPAPDAPPEAAITPPVAAATEGDGPANSGPIPLERHKAVLEAERKKTADLEVKYQRVQWAEALAESGKSSDQIREALSLYDSIDAKPAEFLEQFYTVLQSRPEYQQQLRSFAGKLLGGGRRPVEAADPHGDPEPGPDFQDEKGTPFFSAPQLQKWQTWRERQLEAKMQERMSPLLQAHEQQQKAQEYQQQYQAEFHRQSKALEAMREKPYFKEHEADVKAYLAERQFAGTLEEAYVHVLTTKVLPSLKSNERSATLAELKTQAAASSAQPSAAAPKTPVAPKGFGDPSLKW